jgi:hypothetical protein
LLNLSRYNILNQGTCLLLFNHKVYVNYSDLEHVYRLFASEENAEYFGIKLLRHNNYFCGLFVDCFPVLSARISHCYFKKVGMDGKGFEPSTPTLRTWCSPS